MRRLHCGLAVGLLLVVSACDGGKSEADPSLTSPGLAPEVVKAGMCDDLVAAADLKVAKQGLASRSAGPGEIVCTFTSEEWEIDVWLVVSDNAATNFDLNTLGDDDEDPGFPNPQVSSPLGWWNEAQRLESVMWGAARLGDTMWKDTVFAQVRLFGLKRGNLGVRAAQARDLADRLDAAVGEALGM